jgi:hypothetical protein
MDKSINRSDNPYIINMNVGLDQHWGPWMKHNLALESFKLPAHLKIIKNNGQWVFHNSRTGAIEEIVLGPNWKVESRKQAGQTVYYYVNTVTQREVLIDCYGSRGDS